MGTPEEEGATERGKRVVDALLAAGRRSGPLDVQSEYPVVGGRVDVVWLWPNPILAEPLPVVGFEVESSWRTRKHIKGYYLSLLDLQPAVGIIVLLGVGANVDSTRVFARQMVQRRPGRMLVWSEAEVEALAAGVPPEDLKRVPGLASRALRHSGHARNNRNRRAQGQVRSRRRLACKRGSGPHRGHARRGGGGSRLPASRFRSQAPRVLEWRPGGKYRRECDPRRRMAGEERRLARRACCPRAEEAMRGQAASSARE
jgi:hypothetical protein